MAKLRGRNITTVITYVMSTLSTYICEYIKWNLASFNLFTTVAENTTTTTAEQKALEIDEKSRIKKQWLYISLAIFTVVVVCILGCSIFRCISVPRSTSTSTPESNFYLAEPESILRLSGSNMSTISTLKTLTKSSKTIREDQIGRCSSEEFFNSKIGLSRTIAVRRVGTEPMLVAGLKKKHQTTDSDTKQREKRGKQTFDTYKEKTKH